jgi:GTP-binding protein
VPISAEHGQGLADLHDAIVAALGEERAFGEKEEEEVDFEETGEEGEEEGTGPNRPLKIAIVGRPNAGKSTLLNHLIGEERLLTGPEAGITRDSISIDWEWKGRKIKLFDTAGLRKKAKVQEKLEKLSVADGLRAMQFAEIVVILFDATQPFEKQDLHIADLVMREGRAPVIALSKWDLVEDRQATLAEMHEKAERLLPQVKGLKLVPVSGLTGDGIDKLMQAIFEVHEAWNRRIATAALNRWLDEVVHRHPPPAVSGRRIRIKYIAQIKTRPPTFVAACSRPASLPDAYSRYMVNALRESFDLWGTPIRLHLRKGENPYAGRARKR